MFLIPAQSQNNLDKAKHQLKQVTLKAINGTTYLIVSRKVQETNCPRI